MKKILMVFSLLGISLISQAVTVTASTGNKTFKTYDYILNRDIEAAEKLLKVYMEDSMGCKNIKLDGKVIKQDGFFSSGIFDLTLSANCDSQIRDIKIDFDTLCSAQNHGETALLIKYSKSGQFVSKKIIVQNSASCVE